GGESAIANEQAAGPSGLFQLAVKGMQVGNADRIAGPFGFEEIDLVIEQEATVDLLADVAKRCAGLKAEQIECALQEIFERVAARLRRQIAQIVKFGTQRGELGDIERTPRGLVERTGRLAIQPLHKSDVTVFGVDH